MARSLVSDFFKPEVAIEHAFSRFTDKLIALQLALAGAAGAAQAGAHFRHWKVPPQLGDQARGFNHRVMTAAVAPAENSNASFGDFAQGRRPAAPVLSLEPSPLDCRHALPNELGLQSYMIEHNKNK